MRILNCKLRDEREPFVAFFLSRDSVSGEARWHGSEYNLTDERATAVYNSAIDRACDAVASVFSFEGPRVLMKIVLQCAYGYVPVWKSAVKHDK